MASERYDATSWAPAARTHARPVVDVVRALLAAPVDEERGRGGHAAQVRALHVLGEPVRPTVPLQCLGEARHVEPESVGVRHQIGQLQLVLVLEELVASPRNAP
jgi:hypothetical protein